MSAVKGLAKNVAKFLFLLAAPVLLTALWLIFVVSDIFSKLQRSARSTKRSSADFTPPRFASVVIPNSNGKDLLSKYLPPLIEACREGDEIIVVDNASVDGSAEFVKK